MTLPMSLPVAVPTPAPTGRQSLKLLAAALQSTGDPVPAQVVQELARSPSPTPTEQSSLYSEHDSFNSEPYVVPTSPLLEASDNEFARLLGRRDACVLPDGDDTWKAQLSHSLVEGFPKETPSRRSSVISMRRAGTSSEGATSTTSLPIACQSGDSFASTKYSSNFTHNGSGRSTVTRTSVMSSRSLLKDDPLPPLPLLSRASSASSRYSSILDTYLVESPPAPLCANTPPLASSLRTTRPVSLPVALPVTSSRLSSSLSKPTTKDEPLPPLPLGTNHRRESVTLNSSSTSSTNVHAASSERGSRSIPASTQSRASSASSMYSGILDSYLDDLAEQLVDTESRSSAEPTQPASQLIASSRLSSISTSSATKRNPLLPPPPTGVTQSRNSATSSSSSNSSTNAHAPSSERDSLSMPASTHSCTSSTSSGYITHPTTNTTPLPPTPRAVTPDQHIRTSSTSSRYSTSSACSTKDTPLPPLPPTESKPTHQRFSSASSALKGLPPIPEGPPMPYTHRPFLRSQTDLVLRLSTRSEPTTIRRPSLKIILTDSAPLPSPAHPSHQPSVERATITTSVPLPYPGLSNRTLQDLKAEKKARRKSMPASTALVLPSAVSDLRRGPLTRLLRGGQHPQVIAQDLADREWLEAKHEESLERATKDAERLQEYWATARMPSRNVSGGERRTVRECRHGKERVARAKREAEEAERVAAEEDDEVRRRAELRERAAEYAKHS